MALFPQVASGAVTQFPTRSALRYLTRVNTLADGAEYKYADQASALGGFEVSFEQLLGSDIDVLIAFFNARYGTYQRFTFLDPLRNLVKWSEDFAQPVWNKFAPGNFTFSSGQADPLGGTGAQLVTNSGGSTNSIWQDIPASPESQHFTGSIWLKQSTPGLTVIVRVEDGLGQQQDFDARPGANWERVWATTKFSASAAAVTRLTFIFPASASVYTFGAQLAYLPGPGGYSKNQGSTGVHPTCRFEEPDLAHRVHNFGAHGTMLRILEIAA